MKTTKTSRYRITKRQWLMLLAVAIAIGVGIWFILAAPRDAGGAAGGRKGGDRNKAQPVSASEVKIQDVPIWINAIGTMVPKNLVTVRSRVDGELMKLHFQEGQLVKAGQLLAELDPRPAQVQLTQANGQLARDTAQLKNAQVDLERYRTLLAQDSIARQQVDTQEALVRQYQGTVEVDRGVVANAQLQLAYTRITAPIAGRIGLRQVDPGNIVHAGDTNGVVVIAQVQPITTLFSVPEANLPTVTRALADKQPTVVEVWNRELKNRLAVGRLLTADNLIDTATGTLKLKAEFANQDNTLFPNQFVNVRLSAGTAVQAKVVPGSSVLRGAKGNYVYVIKDNKVSAVQVRMGPINGDQVVIEGPVEAGAQVVTDGADKLRDGAEVQVISAEARSKATSDDGKQRRRGKRDGANGQNGAPGAAQPGAAPAAAPAATAPAGTPATTATADSGKPAAGDGPRGEGGGGGERRGPPAN